MIGICLGLFIGGAFVGMVMMMFVTASSERTQQIEYQLSLPRFKWHPNTERPAASKEYLVKRPNAGYMVATYGDIEVCGISLRGQWYVWNGGEQVLISIEKWVEIRDEEDRGRRLEAQEDRTDSCAGKDCE